MSKRISDTTGREEIFYDANENFSNEKSNMVHVKPGGFELPDERIKSVKDQTKRENKEYKENLKLYESAYGKDASKKLGERSAFGKIFKSRFVQGALGAPTFKDRNRARLKKKKHTKKKYTKKKYSKKKYSKKKHVYKRTRRKSNKFRKKEYTRRKQLGGMDSGRGGFDYIGGIEEVIEGDEGVEGVEGVEGGERFYALPPPALGVPRPSLEPEPEPELEPEPEIPEELVTPPNQPVVMAEPPPRIRPLSLATLEGISPHVLEIQHIMELGEGGLNANIVKELIQCNVEARKADLCLEAKTCQYEKKILEYKLKDCLEERKKVEKNLKKANSILEEAVKYRGEVSRDPGGHYIVTSSGL